jgi:hypothetical protein
MINLAPITLFVYNRPWHTQQTVEALMANEFAAESNLIIFADGAKSTKDKDKVTEVRQYIHSITGFKSIKIYEQNANQGLANSVIAGVTKVINEFGRIIVLEDDMVTSPYFLRYMNEALEMYKNDKKVISIHGYMFPVKGELPDTFFLRGADCWGWATWKRGWDCFEEDGQALTEKFNKELIKEFNYINSYPFYKMLQDQIKGKVDSWAIRWYASAFLQDKLTLYPGKSLVENIGLDGSGIHVAENSIEYQTLLSREQIKLIKQKCEKSEQGFSLLQKYFFSIKKSLLRCIIEKIQYECKRMLHFLKKKNIFWI